MSNLLRAGTRRYIRSPIWWLAVAASIISGLLLGDTFHRTDRIEPSYYIIPMIIFSVLISLSVGKEFNNGAIRNKIISGHKKQTVFFSEIILGTSACYILFLILLSILSIMGSDALQRIPFRIRINAFFGFSLIVVASAILCILVSVLFTRRAVSAVLSLILMLSLTYVSDEIYLALCRPEYTMNVNVSYDSETGKPNIVHGEYGKNPDYIGGVKRKLYQFIIDIIPSGQAEEYTAIFNDLMRDSDTPHILEAEQRTALRTHIPYSVAVIIILSAAGCFIFRLRDMK